MRLDGLTLESLEVDAAARDCIHRSRHALRQAGAAVGRQGIARLHEPVIQQAEHDSLIRQLLNAGRGVRLKVLFRMTEYPQDMTLFHAQGHSVCRFLLSAGHSRAALLEFVGNGMGMNDNTADGMGPGSEGPWVQVGGRAGGGVVELAPEAREPAKDRFTAVPGVSGRPARPDPTA